MSYVAKVTVDHTKVPSNLTDFRLFVDLATLPSSFWSVVKNGGGDIRVFKSDGTTELAREVAYCKRLSDDLASYYAFSNGAYLTDSKGSNNLTGYGSHTQQSSGYNGYCGSGDSVGATTNFGLTGTDDVTISWRGKFTTDITSSGCGMFFMGSTLTTDRLLAMDYDYNGGSRRLNIYNASNSISASYSVSLGTSWHRFTIKRKGGKVSLIIDGVKVLSDIAQGSTTGGQNACYLGTGKQWGGISSYWYDEWAVHTRALSDKEALNLYNGGSDLLYSSFATSYCGELYVKYAGTLSSTVDTEVRIYADGSSSDYATTDTYGRNNVWTGYKAVLHHLDSAVDSSGNGDWTDTGSPSYSDLLPVTGVDIASTSKYVTRNNDGGLTSRTASITMSTIAKFKTGTTGSVLLCWGDYAQSFYYELRYENIGGTWKLCGIKQTGSEIRNDVNWTPPDTTNPNHMALRFDGTSLKHYANGSQIGTQNPSAGSSSNSFMDNMSIGAIPHSSGYMQNFWGDCVHSETRFYLGDLGADWLTAEKNNLISPSTFYAVASPPNSLSLTKSAQYTVKITPSAKTKSLQYIVKAPVSITKSAQYCVKVAPQTAKTKSAQYTVKITPSAKTKSLAYSVAVPTSVTKSLQYAVKSPQSITKGLTYNVRSLASFSKTLQYAIVVPIQKTKSLAYSVAVPTSVTKSLAYSVTSQPVVQKALAYAVIAPAFVQKTAQYSITYTQTAKTKTLAYGVLTTASITKGLAYSIAVPTAVTKSLQYVVTGQALLQKSMQYVVISSNSITKGLEYRILTTPASTEKTLTYVVVKPNAITKSAQYTVSSVKSVTKSLAYEVSAPVAITKSLQYAVVQAPASIQKTLTYEVVTAPSITKALAYAVTAPVSVTKTLTYHVAQPESVTKTIQYAVKSTSVITQQLKYVVSAGVAYSITKSLSYEVTTAGNLVKALSYQVKNNAVITKTLTYRVLRNSNRYTKRDLYTPQSPSKYTKRNLYSG